MPTLLALLLFRVTVFRFPPRRLAWVLSVANRSAAMIALNPATTVPRREIPIALDR